MDENSAETEAWEEEIRLRLEIEHELQTENYILVYAQFNCVGPQPDRIIKSKVNKYIEKGYLPLGSPYYDRGGKSLFQAMVKANLKED